MSSPGPGGASAGRSAPGPKDLLFFFDFSSPFAYLGATQVEGVARRNGARLFYRPFLLGGLFKQIGTPDVPFFAMPAAKQRHTSADMARWADYWRVPFRFPSRFPMNTTKPLRMILQLPELHRARLTHPIFFAYWADDRDIQNDAVLVEIANRAGFDGARMVAESRETRWKTALRTATERAEVMGVCGAPCFLVRDPMRPQQPLLFWGQDRLVMVERALQGWPGGAFDGEPSALPDEPPPETRQAPDHWEGFAESQAESVTRVPLDPPTDFAARQAPARGDDLDAPTHTAVRAPLPSVPEEHTRPDYRPPVPSLSDEVTHGNADEGAGLDSAGRPSDAPTALHVSRTPPEPDEPE